MEKLARALLLLSVPILLVASPLYLLVTPGYVRCAYAQADFPASARFAPAERQRLSDVLVGYLRGRASLSDMAGARTDAGQIALLPEEVQHMADVRQVMEGFYVAHAVALALAVAGSLWLLLRHRPMQWAMALRWGIWATAGFIAVVAVAALADFDLFFTWFHRIFFQEGTWTFRYEDTLIQLYPLPLWIRAVRDISILVLSGAALLYGASRWVESRQVRGGAP